MYSVGDLLAFLQVVEKGSVNEAAKVIGRDPATISRRLSKLEYKLGAKLIDRNTRSMDITPQGKYFHQRAAWAIGQLHNAEQAVRGYTGESDELSLLTIYCPQWLLHAICVPLTNIVGVDEYAEIAYVSDEKTGAIPLSNLSITVGPPALGCTEQVQLLNNRKILCASPDYLSKFGSINGLDDLHNATCISLNGQVNWDFNAAGGERTVKDILCTDSTARLALGVAGAGVVEVDSLLAKKALERGELVEVLPGFLSSADNNIYLSRGVWAEQNPAALQWYTQVATALSTSASEIECAITQA